MDTDPTLLLVIGLGAVCVIVVVLGGIFDLIVTAYACRRLKDEVALDRALGWLAVSRRLSNPAFIGLCGCFGVAYLAYDEQIESLLAGRAWALALVAVVLLGIGVGQVVLARFVNARLGH